jgi:hypothetical protein
MEKYNFQHFLQKINQKCSPYFTSSFALIVLLSTFGCVKKETKNVQLEIQNIKSIASSGEYVVNGSTNLPESSQITVTAVRYLHQNNANEDVSLESEENINRTILARRIVEVKQGQWQANLNLWQIDVDGNKKEVWQESLTQIKLQPKAGVSFIATYEPLSQWRQFEKEKSIEKKVEARQLDGKLVRFTKEGEEYVQASQTIAIALPTQKTTLSASKLQKINNTGGNKDQISLVPVNYATASASKVNIKRTTAPLRSDQFLR